MNALKMDTGPYRLAPLDEFVVTAKNFNKQKVEWHKWYVSAGYPDYTMVNDNQLVFKTQKEPDVEVIMPDRDPPYELIWAK